MIWIRPRLSKSLKTAQIWPSTRPLAQWDEVLFQSEESVLRIPLPNLVLDPEYYIVYELHDLYLFYLRMLVKVPIEILEVGV